MKKRLQAFFCDKLFTALFILTLLFIVAALVSMAFPKSSIFFKAINSVDTMAVGELYDGEELELNFISPKDNLMGISLKVSTYGRDLSGGTLFIRLLDEGGTELFSKEVAVQSIKDRSPLEFEFPQIAISKNKEFAVHFHTEGIEKAGAVTLMANDNIIEGVSTTLNGVTCANLVFTLQYDLAIPYYNLRYAFDFALISAVLFVLTVAAYGRNRPQKDVAEKLT